MTAQTQQAFQRETAHYKRMVLQAKLTSRRAFCTENTAPFGIHHKLANGKLHAPTKFHLLHAMTEDESPTVNTLNAILDAVLLQDDMTEDTAEQQQQRTTATDTSIPDDKDITAQELIQILRCLPKKKAPGPDGVNYNIVKAVLSSNTEFFTSLLSRLYSTGTFPRCFKVGQAMFFLKKNRDPSNPDSAYRTTATSALNILAGLVPLHIIAEREAVLQQVKQLRQPATLYEDTYWPRDYEIPANPLEYHPAQQRVGVRINLKGRPDDMNRHNTRIFTDQKSKMDENVGCAYVMFQGQEQVA
ncbi:hypothetical protein X975_01371, partial [Stegodyphus mimosarum]